MCGKQCYRCKCYTGRLTQAYIMKSESCFDDKGKNSSEKQQTKGRTLIKNTKPFAAIAKNSPFTTP